MLRKGCNHTSERFDNMSEVAAFWHTKQAFLSVSLCNPIEMKSTIIYLCIDFFWNWERWNNIFSTVIKLVWDPVNQQIENYLENYI